VCALEAALASAAALSDAALSSIARYPGKVEPAIRRT